MKILKNDELRTDHKEILRLFKNHPMTLPYAARKAARELGGTYVAAYVQLTRLRERYLEVKGTKKSEKGGQLIEVYKLKDKHDNL